MTNIPDSHRDLLDGPMVIIATVGPDGRPQQSVTWFLAEDDGTVRVSLNTTRQKTKNLLANPVIDLLFIDTTASHRYLEIRGDATIEPDDAYELAERVGAKYGGVDLRSMDQPGEGRVAVTVVPTRVNAIDMRAGLS